MNAAPSSSLSYQPPSRSVAPTAMPDTRSFIAAAWGANPDIAGTIGSPPIQMPVPESPTPLPPEMPQPVLPITEPSPTENPIPVREPPSTLPPQY